MNRFGVEETLTLFSIFYKPKRLAGGWLKRFLGKVSSMQKNWASGKFLSFSSNRVELFTKIVRSFWSLTSFIKKAPS